MPLELQKLADMFQQLGHPVKLKILRHLIECQDDEDYPRVPAMVSTRLDLPAAVTAHNMKRMSQVGILIRRVSGRYSFYSIDPTFFERIKEFLYYEGS